VKEPTIDEVDEPPFGFDLHPLGPCEVHIFRGCLQVHQSALSRQQHATKGNEDVPVTLCLDDNAPLAREPQVLLEQQVGLRKGQDVDARYLSKLRRCLSVRT
jgi:hypothetical protein